MGAASQPRSNGHGRGSAGHGHGHGHVKLNVGGCGCGTSDRGGALAGSTGALGASEASPGDGDGMDLDSICNDIENNDDYDDDLSYGDDNDKVPDEADAPPKNESLRRFCLLAGVVRTK